MTYTDYSQIMKELRSDLSMLTNEVNLAQRRARTLAKLQEENKSLNRRVYLTLLLDSGKFDSFFRAASSKVSLWKHLKLSTHYVRQSNRKLFVAYAKYLSRIEHYGEFLAHSEGYIKLAKQYANFHPSTDFEFMKTVGESSADIVYNAYFNLLSLVETGFINELEKSTISNAYETVAKIVFLTGEIEQAKTYALLPGSYLTQMLVSLNSNH